MEARTNRTGEGISGVQVCMGVDKALFTDRII
jgi:hypothetical protein